MPWKMLNMKLVEKPWWLFLWLQRSRYGKLLWLMVTYVCEAWTLNQKRVKIRLIKAFEMKGRRQILHVSWMEKRTDKWVLEKACITWGDYLESTKQKNCLQPHHEEIRYVLGEISNAWHSLGFLKLEKPCGRWMDDIIHWIGMTLEQAIRER